MLEFTRYLYLKEHVKTAFIGSMLLKQKNEALFWAFELYHSGFRDDTFSIIWKTYYGFYASQNPLLEAYMKKKMLKDPTPKDDVYFIVSFISNMLIRSFNLDVFMLSGVVVKTEEDDDAKMVTLLEALETRNYESVAYYMNRVHKNKKDMADAAKTLKGFFETQGCAKTLVQTFTGKCENVNEIVIIIARIMACFMQIENKHIPPKKHLYVVVDDNITKEYDTMEVCDDNQSPAKLFPTLVKYSVHCSGILTAFFPCCSQDIVDEYRNNWHIWGYLYTPIWKERIASLGGAYNEETGRMQWDNLDDEERFYAHYWYDTDEQPREVWTKNIPMYESRMSLTEFYNTYKKNSLYVPCKEMLEALVD